MINIILLWNSIIFSICQSLLVCILFYKANNQKLKLFQVFLTILASCSISILNTNLVLISTILFTFIIIFKKCKNALLSFVLSTIPQILFLIASAIPTIVAILIIKENDLDFIKNTFWFNFLYSIAYLSITYLLYTIISNLKFNFSYVKNFKYKISKSYNIIIINIILFFIIICFMPTIYELKIPIWKVHSIVYTFLSVIFTINCLVSFLIYKVILKAQIKEAKSELEITLTKEYKNTIENLYDDIMDFKHDYLKIYSSMQLFIKEKNMDGLSDFFYKNIFPISKEITSKDVHEKCLLYIEDIALQSTIYTAIITANAKNIPILIDIKERIPIFNIDSVDLIRVIGILIQNAFEACENLAKPDVQIGIIRENQITILVIKNTCEIKEVDFDNIFKKGKTTKKGINHGRGLNIVKSIIDPYPNITLNAQLLENYFICELFVEDK